MVHRLAVALAFLPLTAWDGPLGNEASQPPATAKPRNRTLRLKDQAGETGTTVDRLAYFDDALRGRWSPVR
jgi:hypothetical protein